MTQNQIAYWNLRESERHNKVGEQETARHNVSQERETNRHNVMTEHIDIGNLNESIRHNMVTEHETNRHNLVTESQGERDLNIKQGALEETRRHNVQQEQISLSDLAERSRHNLASEKLTAKSQIETTRANRAKEKLTASSLSETKRANLRNEMLKSQAQAESKRSNKANELIANRNSDIRAKEVALKDANEKANIAISKWNASSHSNLTKAQVREMDARIQKYKREMQSTNVHDEATKISTAINGASQIVHLIDALIPG